MFAIIVKRVSAVYWFLYWLLLLLYIVLQVAN